MRGQDAGQGGMWSYIQPEQGPPGPPPPPDPGDGGPGPEDALAPLRPAVLPHRPPLDPAGATAPGPAAPGLLQRPERAPTHGAARLQPPVPVVRRPEHG